MLPPPGLGRIPFVRRHTTVLHTSCPFAPARAAQLNRGALGRAAVIPSRIRFVASIKVLGAALGVGSVFLGLLHVRHPHHRATVRFSRRVTHWTLRLSIDL